MLADAIAAERYRLIRDRASVFWGFLFVPIAALAFGLLTDLFVRATFRQALPGATTDLAARVLKALDGGASPFVALFLLIGAAAIVAGDYRWETWRLITPRNSRLNLLAAKLIVFAEAAAWSLGLMALSALIGGVFSAVIHGAPIVGPSSGAVFGKLAGVFAITWLQLMVIGALAALVGVISRSTMGATITAIVVVVIQSIVATQMREPTWRALSLPAYAGDVLKGFIVAPPSARPDSGPAGLALILLLLWLAVLTTGAIVAFQRQDLTRE